jgi:hypothetical protein
MCPSVNPHLIREVRYRELLTRKAREVKLKEAIAGLFQGT